MVHKTSAGMCKKNVNIFCLDLFLCAESRKARIPPNWSFAADDVGLNRRSVFRNLNQWAANIYIVSYTENTNHSPTGTSNMSGFRNIWHACNNLGKIRLCCRLFVIADISMSWISIANGKQRSWQTWRMISTAMPVRSCWSLTLKREKRYIYWCRKHVNCKHELPTMY